MAGSNMMKLEMAFKAAKAEARDLATSFDHGQTAIDLIKLCAALGVRNVIDIPMLATGLLVATDHGGWNVFVKAGLPETRRRFTIAHEIGHLLLDRAKGISQHCHSRDENRVYSQEERFADQIAGEILMPEHTILLLLNEGTIDRRTTCQQLYVMARRFQTSLSAMAFRMLECESLATVLARRNPLATLPFDQFRIDCSKHTQIRFLDMPSAVIGKAAASAFTHGRAEISVEIWGHATHVEVSACTRQISRGAVGCEEWTVGWHRL